MQTVRVLSTLALKGAVTRLAGEYEATTGVRIDADFAPTVGLLPRLRGGEKADIVMLTREGLDELAAEGAVIAASVVDLARSYVGVAVKAGAAHPDIATEAAFRASVLAARSVAYSKIGASGIYFAELIGRLGIAAAINAKATITSGLRPNGSSAAKPTSPYSRSASSSRSTASTSSGRSRCPCRRQRCSRRDGWRHRRT